MDGTLLGASHIKIILDKLYAKWVTIAENAKMSWINCNFAGYGVIFMKYIMFISSICQKILVERWANIPNSKVTENFPASKPVYFFSKHPLQTWYIYFYNKLNIYVLFLLNENDFFCSISKPVHLANTGTPDYHDQFPYHYFYSHNFFLDVVECARANKG